jgi:glutamine synthetase
MGSAALAEAAKSIREWSLTNRISTSPAVRVADVFGTLVFHDKLQRERLPKSAYRALRATVTRGEPLDASTADAVAVALKDWAIEQGATHYAHWFQPMTGITAEKHDSFLNPAADGTAIAEFSGKELVRGEPDASSFPSGGMRSTFEARGYTAWDPTSNPWLLVNGNSVTLAIPTAFVSWTGEALDKKTPLLRSMEAVSKQAVRVLKLFGSTAEHVFATCGPEQEYFLIDRNFYFARPDLINAGRTLFGARPPKGQELEDQYFGAIPERVQACMAEVELELYKVGVPVKTRHNEVAPSQYEIAPVFENANVAVDHQMMTMETLRRVAPSTGSRACCTKSRLPASTARASTTTGRCPTSSATTCSAPATPRTTTCSSWSSAPRYCGRGQWQGLLRATIASAGNDHRLGANEAPPAILSVFLGEQLTDIFEQLEKGAAKSTKQGGIMDVGVSVLPKLPRDAGDRNRTSPFAFTGNKFEFRAVSSGQNIAFPNTALNAAMADALDSVAAEIEAALAKGTSLEAAVKALLTKMAAEHKRIVFNGNGYSAEWQAEAAARGLLNLRNTVDALPQLVTPECVALFEKYKILNRREMHARYEIFLETYNKTINIEGQLMVLMANRYILPAALEYQKQIALSVGAVRAVGATSAEAEKLLVTYTALVDQLKAKADVLAGLLDHESGGAEAHAAYMRDAVVPAMATLREVGDAIEVLTPHGLWPLPTYREMLFVK